MLTIGRWPCALLAIAMATMACTPASQPAHGVAAAAAPAVEPTKVAPAPQLLDPGMRTALVTQTAIVEEAANIAVSELLPNAPTHEAGAATDADAAPPANPAADIPDAQKIALMFTGHDVGELDPCG